MSEMQVPPAEEEPERNTSESEVSRREFFDEIATFSLSVATVGAGIVTYQYLSPNVLFEPPTRFRIGTPDDYPLNSVTYLREQQVYIVRTVEGIYAESAVCTHLGCITAWNPETNLIECPCHGSKFNRDGTKVAGPAPRPLPHFVVLLAADGGLVVDKLEGVQNSQILKV
jgi:cytochrome b6-f complex iron-sulfur subunit